MDDEVADVLYSDNKDNHHRTTRRPTDESVATKLIAIGQSTQLVHDEQGDGYAVIQEGVRRDVLRLRGRPFRRWLARAFYVATKTAAGAEAIQAAISVLDAVAVHDHPEVAIGNRFVRSQDAIWVDLGDATGRAVRVTGQGWEVQADHSVLFRRFSHTVALPEPRRGGRLEDLLPFLNVAREEDRLLLLAWLAAAPVADIPRPALALHGPQGSAKTTAARLLRSLLDPSFVETVDLGTDQAELAQILAHHAVPCFDNLNRLAPWQEDMLCRAVTGGGFSKRELYTDEDDVLMRFKRPIILTGINVPTTAPDMLDRLLLVGLERVAPTARREEAVLLATFEDLRPWILGGLFDALSGAMAIYATATFRELPRMADFARWGAAAAEALGYGKERFMTAMLRNAEEQVAEVLEHDPVARAILAFVEAKGRWTGTATDLLAELERHAGDTQRSREWPKGVNQFSKRLRLLQAPLADAGVVNSFSRGHRQGRLITLALASAGEDMSSPPSPSSTGSLHPTGPLPKDLTAPPPVPGDGAAEKLSSRVPGPAEAGDERTVGTGGHPRLPQEGGDGPVA